MKSKEFKCVCGNDNFMMSFKIKVTEDDIISTPNEIKCTRCEKLYTKDDVMKIW